MTSLSDHLAQLSPEQRKALAQTLQQTSPHRASGSDIVAKTLRSAGITHVYGINGVPIDRTLGSCTREGIRVIGTRHQQGATLMAAAHNYAAGDLVAAVVVSSGPAIANIVTGMLVAWDNAWPLLAIAGGRSDGQPGTFQKLDAATTMFDAIAKASVRVTTPDEIVPTLTRAVQLATSDRPGPVFIDIDAGVFTRSTSIPVAISLQSRQAPVLDEAAIAQAGELLERAERPLLVIGKGVRWSQAHLELKPLVERGIPFLATPMGRGYVPDDEPRNVTPAAALALSTADVVLSVGARWNWTLRFGAELAETVKLIQIDIHPPEIGCNVRPAVGVVGDAKTTLARIASALDELDWRPAPATQIWHDRLKLAARENCDRSLKLVNETESPMRLQTLMAAIAEVLPRDAITVLDGNYTLEAGLRLLPCYEPASRFTPGTNGCMGTGVPFAIAAKVANPERVVVAICGDLSFGMTAMELETAVRYRIPIIAIVANNQGHGGSYRQHRYYGSEYSERISMFVPDARYEMLSIAFGGFGRSVQTADELVSALHEAIAANVPACLNVRIDPDAPSPRL